MSTSLTQDQRIRLMIDEAGLDKAGLDVGDDGEGLVSVTDWSTARRICFELSATNGRDHAVHPVELEPGWDWELFTLDDDGWRANGIHGWVPDDAAMAGILRGHLPQPAAPETAAAPPAE
jgi:hypothetical protein